MDGKKIFRGFKQVSFETFNDVEDKSGYLWFVRQSVIADGETAETNDVSNDSYDIYFGSKHYGHFCEGEIESIKSAIAGLGANVDEIVSTLETMTTAIENNKKAHEENAAAITALDGKFADHFSTVSYEGNKILFKNANGDVKGEVDATPFVKDGILDDVEVVTIEEVDEENNPHGLVAGEKYIKFVWNTDGDSKEDYILASEIGATYAGSDSIEISSENVVSLKSASAEKVQVTEIPVGGTPLADLLTANNINTINAGNLQAVLESLFSQNNWAENPRRNVPTGLTVSMSAPSISLDKTGTQEVGTSVSLSASAKTASASANITYSGFTYGYSVENDNTRDAEGNPSSVSITGSVKSGSTYNLTFVTNNGFGGATVPSVTGSTTSGNTLIVAEGTNKVTVTAKSPEFTATVPGQDAIYACSSLKKTDDSHVVAASTATTINGSVKSATANTSVTGAYKVYVGYTNEAITDSDGIKGLSAQSGWTNGDNSVSFAGDTFPAGKVSNIAMPSAWSLKEVKNGMDLVITDNFAKVDVIEYVLPDNTKTKYKVYSNLYGANVAYNSITIGK